MSVTKSADKKKECKPRAVGVLPPWDEVVGRLRAGMFLDAGHLAVIRGCSRECIIDLKGANDLRDPKGIFVDCDVEINCRVMGWSRPRVYQLYPHLRALIEGDSDS